MPIAVLLVVFKGSGGLSEQIENADTKGCLVFEVL